MAAQEETDPSGKHILISASLHTSPSVRTAGKKMVWEKTQLLSEQRQRRGLYTRTYASTSQRVLDALPGEAFLPACSRAVPCSEEMLWALIPQGFSPRGTVVILCGLESSNLSLPEDLGKPENEQKARPGHGKWRAKQWLRAVTPKGDHGAEPLQKEHSGPWTVKMSQGRERGSLSRELEEQGVCSRYSQIISKGKQQPRRLLPSRSLQEPAAKDSPTEPGLAFGKSWCFDLGSMTARTQLSWIWV